MSGDVGESQMEMKVRPYVIVLTWREKLYLRYVRKTDTAPETTHRCRIVEMLHCFTRFLGFKIQMVSIDNFVSHL